MAARQQGDCMCEVSELRSVVSEEIRHKIMFNGRTPDEMSLYVMTKAHLQIEQCI